VTREADTLRAMGLSSTDVARMQHLANTAQMVQRQSPEQLSDMFADGPATLMELAAAISGAKWGQAASGAGPGPTGIGSSLVLAQFGSRTTRRLLSTVFDDASTRILREASEPTARGRELYQALLTTPTASVREQERAAGVILGYLYPGAAVGAQEIGEVLSEPENRQELMGVTRQAPRELLRSPLLEAVGVDPHERLRGLLSPEQQGAGLLER